MDTLAFSTQKESWLERTIIVRGVSLTREYSSNNQAEPRSEGDFVSSAALWVEIGRPFGKDW
jgi:hypothetical protein